MSRYQRRYSWPSLATPSYRLLLPGGLQEYLLYRHTVAVCRFELSVMPFHVHVKGSIGVTSLSSSLLLHQCPTCLVRLILIFFVMVGRWPYSCCFVGYCLQDLFKIARSILVLLPSTFFSIRLVSAHVVNPYSSIDTAAAWKKLRIILSVRSNFHMTDSLWIAVYAFASRCLSRLIRHCFLGRWTRQLVSESYRLVWRRHLFD